MLSVVYRGKGDFALLEKPMPKLLDEKDAIVRVTLSSICQSDIHIKHGSVPRAVPGTTVGHEFVGVVEEVGPGVRKLKPGMRVAANVETFCGECFFCKRGFVNNCTDKNGGWALGCRIDGGQAPYVRVPFADNGLTPIPEGISDEKALFTGDILATGYWAAGLAEIQPADTVAVIGAGPTGMCTLMSCRLYSPATLIAIDTTEDRLRLAREKGLADVPRLRRSRAHSGNPCRTIMDVVLSRSCLFCRLQMAAFMGVFGFFRACQGQRFSVRLSGKPLFEVLVPSRCVSKRLYVLAALLFVGFQLS